MKLVLLFAVAATATVPLVGQASPEPAWVVGLGHLGGLGVLGWAVWYLLTKTVPDQQRTFRKSLESIQESHLQTLDTITERHERWEESRHRDSEQLNTALREMSAQCAVVQAESHQD